MVEQKQLLILAFRKSVFLDLIICIVPTLCTREGEKNAITVFEALLNFKCVTIVEYNELFAERMQWFYFRLPLLKLLELSDSTDRKPDLHVRRDSSALIQV